MANPGRLVRLLQSLVAGGNEYTALQLKQEVGVSLDERARRWSRSPRPSLLRRAEKHGQSGDGQELEAAESLEEGQSKLQTPPRFGATLASDDDFTSAGVKFLMSAAMAAAAVGALAPAPRRPSHRRGRRSRSA